MNAHDKAQFIPGCRCLANGDCKLDVQVSREEHARHGLVQGTRRYLKHRPENDPELTPSLLAREQHRLTAVRVEDPSAKVKAEQVGRELLIAKRVAPAFLLNALLNSGPRVSGTLDLLPVLKLVG